MSLMAVISYGYGWWQAVARLSEGTGRARLCGYVKHSTLFCHRTGIARSEGRGQGQRKNLCLAGALSL